jgi:uroporphyrinogen decarboxylase
MKNIIDNSNLSSPLGVRGIMTHKERFFATISNQPVDRPASWLGLPVPAAVPELLRYFRVNSVDELKIKLDDDIYPIEVPYNFPPSNHIACAFKFAKMAHDDKPDERTLTAPGFFEDIDDPALVDTFPWPDPALYLDVEESRRLAMAADPDYIRMGVMWSAHFQDACAAFGMEKALMVMLMNPDMFQAVIDRITDFYLKANEIFYEATKGYLDAVLIGNDFGSQCGLMVDPDSLRTYVFPGTKKIIDQAKSYGLKVIHHSCGSIYPIIQDLMDLGVDSIHPIQALAQDMDASTLKAGFEGKTSFCGGVDAQHLLVNGTPDQVAAKVHELKQLFPTGLIVSPSHEAILPDIPPANIEAMFNALKS